MNDGYPKEKYHVYGGSVTVRDKEHDKQFPYPDWQDQPFVVAEPVKVKRSKRIEEPIEAS